jgi:hypothetical protein
MLRLIGVSTHCLELLANRMDSSLEILREEATSYGHVETHSRTWDHQRMTRAITLPTIKRLFGGWVWGSPLLWWSSGAVIYAVLVGWPDKTTIWSAFLALLSVLFIWAKAIPASVTALHRCPANQTGTNWEYALWARISRFIDANPAIRSRKIAFGMGLLLVVIFGISTTGLNSFPANKINTVIITAMLGLSVLKEWSDLEPRR